MISTDEERVNIRKTFDRRRQDKRPEEPKNCSNVPQHSKWANLYKINL